MTDKTELHWSKAGHPTATVLDTARKSAFLSHTRLIEMNTGRTANDAPNLFPVAVELLADLRGDSGAGGLRRTIGELWAEVNAALERRVLLQQREHVVRRISRKKLQNAYATSSTKRMKQALAALGMAHAKSSASCLTFFNRMRSNWGLAFFFRRNL